jgi:CRISPR-associated Csx2 family protein
MPSERPARRTLISFLGAQYGDTQTGEPSYRLARYALPGVPPADEKLFVRALVPWLTAQGRPADRLIVAGTPTSMWGVLFELLDGAPRTPQEREFQAEVTYESLVNGLRDELRERLERFLTDDLAQDVRLLLLGECTTDAEQLDVVARITAAVDEGDRLVLDVTHSYRHLPILAIATAQFLRQTRSCVVESVYYGMLEAAAAHGGVAPVVDLGGLLRILEVAEGLAAFRHSGSLLRLAEVFATPLPSLERTAFLLETRQIGDARRAAAETLAQLAQTGDPLARAAHADLGGALDSAARDVSLAHRQLELARNALACGDLRGAAELATEAVVEAGLRGLKSRTGDPDRGRLEVWALLRRSRNADWPAIKALRAVRNALVHGSRPDVHEAQRALHGRDTLRTFLREKLAVVARVVGS